MFVFTSLTLFFIILFLETVETAIFVISRGTLIEKEKQEGENGPYTKALFLKAHVKEVMIIVLVLDTILHYVLSFYLAKCLAIYNYSPLITNLFPVLFATIVVYLTIVFKTFAINHAQSAIKMFGTIFYFVFLFFRPVGAPFLKASGFVQGKNTKNPKEEIGAHKSQLLASLDDYEYTPNTEMHEEIEMVRSILSLKDINLNQIMTPIGDFVSVELSENIETMKERLLPLGFKKNVIIWEETEDNIIGSLNIQKFLIDFVLKRAKKISNYITVPQFFVNTTDAYRVLEHFKTTLNQVVFVINEDGSICGLVSKADIFNEIIGENQEDDYLIKETSSGYLMEGAYSLRLLNRKFDLELPEDCSTIAGLLIMTAKKIPKINEKFSFKDVEFIVKERSKNKIESILMKTKQLNK